MISFLAKFFIKNDDPVSPETRQKYGILCGSVGIFLNILLFIAKFITGTISRSIAITADAFNNLSDAGSSVITLLGFKLAAAKPDPNHPFGHGRIEYISGLIVSGIIVIMAFELLRDSIDKILHPEVTEYSVIALVILIVSIAVKLYMSYYNRFIGKKINSAAMHATATDSFSDAIATTVVLAAALIGKFTGLQIDGYCGVLVALFIFYAGISAAKETIDPLLGQSPAESFVTSIHSIVMEHSAILGIHDLVVHDYGPGRIMISLHAEVPAEENILELHDLIDNIETDLSAKLNCQAVIHMDPVETHNAIIASYKASMIDIIHGIDETLSLHDFRMVSGQTHNNLIFDVVTPYGYHYSDEELKQLIADKTKEILGPNNYVIIQIDKAFS